MDGAPLQARVLSGEGRIVVAGRRRDARVPSSGVAGTPQRPNDATTTTAASKQRRLAEAMSPTPLSPDYKGLLLHFYKTFIPDKVKNVPAILKKYAGTEDVLLAFLEKKYKKPAFFQGVQLDHRSPLFNPALALAKGASSCPGHTLGFRITSTAPLDNIAKCRSLLPAWHPDAVDPNLARQRVAGQRGRHQSKTVGTEGSRRRREPGTSGHSHDVGAGAGDSAGVGRTDNKRSGPLAAIAAAHASGPLSVLKKCFDDRARVQVTVRRIDGVRGTITGFLRAYDNHMNMVLADAEEEYIPSPGFGRKKLDPSKVRQRDKKHRHLPQVLMRGDCVVMVRRYKPSV